MTLIELIVILGILGVLSVAMFGAVGSGVKFFETASASTKSISRIVVSQQFLRAQLSAAVLDVQQNEANSNQDPLERNSQDTSENGAAESWFRGTSTSLKFVAPWLSHIGQGGLFSMNLAIKEGDLRVSWMPLQGMPEGTRPNVGELEGERTLIGDVAELHLMYFGAITEQKEQNWISNWPFEDRLPELVAISVRQVDRREVVWPRFVVALPSR